MSRNTNAYLRLTLITCVVLTLASCRWGPPGIEKLTEYCEKDAELTIGEAVYVDGYHTSEENCFSCYQSIVKEGFDFIEFTVEPQRPGRERYPELGYWRMEKVLKESGQCDPKIQRRLEKKKTPEFKRFVKKYCIATYPIESLKSEYGYRDFMEWKKGVNTKHHSQLKKFRAEVVHIESGHVVSRKVSYRLRPYPNSSLSYGKNFGCDKAGVFFDEGKGASVFLQTLKSSKQRR